MDSFDKKLIDWLISPEIEGGVAKLKGDRGGWTVYGLSSRMYPEIKGLYDNGLLTTDVVRGYYYRDYLSNIYGYSFFKKEMPWLLKLLFPAKVHGSGDEQLVATIQRWLNVNTSSRLITDGVLGRKTLAAITDLDSAGRENLAAYVLSQRDTLAALRAESVGVYKASISNRVKREYAYAFANFTSSLAVEFSPSPVGTSSVVEANFKQLSSNLATANAEGLGVSPDHGPWEDVPLGLDLNISVRRVDYDSSNLDGSPEDLREA